MQLLPLYLSELDLDPVMCTSAAVLSTLLRLPLLVIKVNEEGAGGRAEIPVLMDTESALEQAHTSSPDSDKRYGFTITLTVYKSCKFILQGAIQNSLNPNTDGIFIITARLNTHPLTWTVQVETGPRV